MNTRKYKVINNIGLLSEADRSMYRDKNGEYQAYIVKSYRCCGLTDAIKNPTYSRVMFECKINSFGRERIIKISYSYTDGILRLLGREAY